jgi:hypothetical protein
LDNEPGDSGGPGASRRRAGRAFGRPSCRDVGYARRCIYGERREQTRDERATERGEDGAGETRAASLLRPAASRHLRTPIGWFARGDN